MPKATHHEAWQRLQEHFEATKSLHMRQLFEDDPERFPRFTLQAGDIFLDYSKNRITETTVDLLLALADEAGVEKQRQALFSGERINVTEDRAVLHPALRHASGESYAVEGHEVTAEVDAVLEKMDAFVHAVHSGDWTGYSGKPVRDIVNLGIGGSDLGPRMVCHALQPYARENLRVHFVSNIDGTHLQNTLHGLDPETTLFIVASKSFTTQETLVNANSAKSWLLEHYGDRAAVARHFVALSTNTDAVEAFGIDSRNMFVFWDWVGGRYSLWSAIGLSIALYVGMDHFRALLHGAQRMDRHFQRAPLAGNMPVILALLGIWYHDFFRAPTQAILPYDQSLGLLPRYLQQLDMESNGKRITLDGEVVDYPTGPIVWGEAGTDGQHAFYQLLHQGTHLVPCDFLAPARPQHPLDEHHAILLANFLAQPEALMAGRTVQEAQTQLYNQGLEAQTAADLAVHKTFPGNVPTNALLFEKLTPEVLGSLIALYEHKVFVQGVVWNINSFDQMGVELGKQLAKTILPELSGSESVQGHDSSTAGLIKRLRRMQDR